MTFIFAPFLMIFSAVGGAGNEVLDIIESDVYWKQARIEHSAEALIPLIEIDEGKGTGLAELEGYVEDLRSPEFLKRQKAMAALSKAGADAIPVLEKASNSEDPQVATAASQILGKMDRVASESRLHRLMAIRSLGELKAKDAIPHLEKLMDSREPFIGEYAKRALAEIRGEKYSPPEADPLAYEKDLKITYPKVGMVGHAEAKSRVGEVAIREIMKKSFGDMAGIGGPLGGGEVEGMINEMTHEVTRMFQQLGNIRIDSATFVMPEGVTPESAGFVITARGLYDHKRIVEFVKAEGSAKSTTLKGVEWFAEWDDLFVHFASDELIVLVIGTDVQEYAEAVSLRLSGTDKTPATGAALEMADRVREDSTAFFAAEIPEPLADNVDFLKPVKSFVASAKLNEDGTMSLSAELEGKDDGSIKEMFSQAQLGLSMGKGAITGMAEANKGLKDLKEMMDSIQLNRSGAVIGGSATIPSHTTIPSAMWFMMFGVNRAEDIPAEPIPPDDVDPEAAELAPDEGPEK